MVDQTIKIPWLALCTVTLCAFAAGIGVSLWRAGATPQVEGLLWPDPPVLTRLALTDQHGAAFDLARLRGKWSLLFFGFTHCPDVCPTTLDVMARAARELATHPAYAAHGQLVFVSVDPARDTRGVLGRYVDYFDARMIGATGDEAELKALTRALGALYMRVEQAGAQYTVDHSAGIFFLDPKLRLLSVMTPPHVVADVVTRFDALVAFAAAGN